MIHWTERGEGRRVVYLHGFTQTSESWSAVIDDVPLPHKAMLLDLPWHGRSKANPETFADAARHIGYVAGVGTYVGYSLGARLALRLAIDQPALVDRLVLVSPQPGILDEAERRKRRESDRLLAQHIREIGIERFLDEWIAQPMFENLPRATLEHRLANSAESLARSLEIMGTGEMTPMWDRIQGIQRPTLIVTGQKDVKFKTIGEEMVKRMPHAFMRVLPDAGHACHLEHSAEFGQILTAFLRMK